MKSTEIKTLLNVNAKRSFKPVILKMNIPQELTHFKIGFWFFNSSIFNFCGLHDVLRSLNQDKMNENT